MKQLDTIIYKKKYNIINYRKHYDFQYFWNLKNERHKNRENFESSSRAKRIRFYRQQVIDAREKNHKKIIPNPIK